MLPTTAPAQTPEEERRLRRAAWPVRRFRLGEEPSEDLSESTTIEERMAMMWPLALDAFSHRDGLPESTPRPTWPVKVRKLGEPAID